jgi:type VI secretion system protein ImpC
VVMKKPISFGKIEVHVVSTMEKAGGKPEPETPFRVLIMGDFSGRANRGLVAGSLADRQPTLVDRDNIDGVIAKLGVEIRLPTGKKASPLKVRFQELEDFHPDQLFERVEPLGALREARRKLADPRTFAAAAEELGGRAGTKLPLERKEPGPKKPSPGPRASAPEMPGPTSGSLLDQILEEKGEPPDARAATDTSEWGTFLQEIVRPYLVPRDDPRQAEMLASLDAAAAGLMRAILHHPDFQALESAWRAVRFLVSRVETDTQLKLYLMDISKAELSADLASKEDLQSTGMYRLLVEGTVETPGGEPWAVVGGNYTFGPSREDAELLGRIAKISRAAGAPFVAAASDRLLGCESLAQTPDPREWKRVADADAGRAWEALRKLPEASYLGLALPRFLLRLPYGAGTDPIERFEFEEMTASPKHDHYLWGNPAFGCVYLIAQAFSHYGWDLRPGVVQEIEDLPLHVYKERSESRSTPCAEVLLTERAAEMILDKGFMPLLSLRNQDTIRLARFQSLTDPPSPLAGRWME